MRDTAETLARLREPAWSNETHRERLKQRLLAAHERMRPTRRPWRRVAAIAGAGTLLAGAGYAAAWLHRLGITTRSGDSRLGRHQVEIDTSGRGSFTVPVARIEDLERGIFHFDLEGLRSPWVDFDIRIEDGLAHVSVQEHAVAPIDPKVARAAFDQLEEIAGLDGAELWGVSLEQPVILVDPRTRAVVANRPDPDGLLVEWRGLWAGRFPSNRAIANTSTTWSGRRWTMLAWPLPASTAERARLLAHEAFHSAQYELGLVTSTPHCTHLSTLDGRLWMRLEARALAGALRARVDEGEWEQAATDALLFRAMRRSLFDGSGDREDRLERMEGSAEYTGVRLGVTAHRDRLATTLAGLEGIASRAGLMRSFPYVTGPAWGLLLDACDPFWRDGYLAGEGFGDLLAPVVRFEVPEDLELRATERAIGYGFEQVLSQELERDLKRQERLSHLRARFVEGPILVLPSVAPRNSFDPNGVEALDELGQVYHPLWLADEWGVLEAPGGALVREDSSVQLPAPSDPAGTRLSGEGWTLELEPGWSVVPGDREGDSRVSRSE